jgi:hypothetical protein
LRVAETEPHESSVLEYGESMENAADSQPLCSISLSHPDGAKGEAHAARVMRTPQQEIVHGS